MRFYTRHWVKPKLWWDDGSILYPTLVVNELTHSLSGMLPWVGFHGCAQLSPNQCPAMGRRQGPLERVKSRLETLQEGMPEAAVAVKSPQICLVAEEDKQHFHDTQIIARVGMCCTKVSFLLFYQRLFLPKGVRYTPIWWSIWLCFWYNVLYAISLVITVSTECVGKEDKVAKGQQCVNEYAVLTCASVINASSDLMIFIIPVVSIWGLHMPTERKWKLSAVFFVGFL